MLTTVELFAGIGGFSSPHTRPLAFVEKDAHCRAILRRHYPAALILDDVRTAGAHNLPWAHVVKFGFPCQDLSVAGNRAGLSGARSGLFYEGTRIADELRPDYILWENVPGLLSSGAGRDFLAVLTELDRIGLAGGWTTVDAQFFGVAQRRQRVFGLFAQRDIGAARCAEILSLAARLPWNLTPGYKARANVAATIRAGSSGDGVNKPGRRGDDDVNIVTVIKGAAIGRAPENGPQYGEILDDGTCYTLNCTEVHAVSIAENQRGELRTSDIAAQLTHGGGKPGQGYPAVLAFTSRGRASGAEIESQEDIAYALRTPGGGAQRSQVAGGFGVRRLTPRECERLQGFPDDYTAWGIDEQGGRVEMSDSVRYRMLGNAVCQRVSAWIDSQIVKYL